MKYRYFVILFRSSNGKHMGDNIIKKLSEHIDVSSAEITVDKSNISFRVVTSLTESQIWAICDEIKKSLEKTTDGRLIYKITVINL